MFLTPCILALRRHPTQSRRSPAPFVASTLADCRLCAFTAPKCMQARSLSALTLRISGGLLIYNYTVLMACLPVGIVASSSQLGTIFADIYSALVQHCPLVLETGPPLPQRLLRGTLASQQIRSLLAPSTVPRGQRLQDSLGRPRRGLNPLLGARTWPTSNSQFAAHRRLEDRARCPGHEKSSAATLHPMSAKGGLKRHVRAMHPQAWILEPEVESRCQTASEPRSRPCLACGETFASSTRHRCTVMWQLILARCLVLQATSSATSSLAATDVAQELVQAELANFYQHLAPEEGTPTTTQASNATRTEQRRCGGRGAQDQMGQHGRGKVLEQLGRGQTGEADPPSQGGGGSPSSERPAPRESFPPARGRAGTIPLREGVPHLGGCGQPRGFWVAFTRPASSGRNRPRRRPPRAATFCS